MIAQAKKIAKNALRPLRTSWFHRDQAAIDLMHLGVRQGGVLLVHSSLSACGYVPGGPAEIIRVLLEAVGEQGTLVLPTHTWQWMNQGSREFDVRSTPSCVGQITETFRKMPGVDRSLHPTHSVAAIGVRSRELTGGHEMAATPCGYGTPYEKILLDGQILLLGVGLESNTVFHSIEAFCNSDYLLQEESEIFTLVDATGNARRLPIRRHANGIARRFPEMLAYLKDRGALHEGRVGIAQALLLEGGVFQEAMVDLMRNDPDCLTEKAYANA
jgi:aminoglycoside 3-N-acetyltransferase